MAKAKEAVEELSGEEYKTTCYLFGVVSIDRFIEGRERMAAFAARRSLDHERRDQWRVCRTALLELLPEEIREEYEDSLLDEEEPEDEAATDL